MKSFSERPPATEPDPGQLASAGRLAALRDVGLTAAPDEAMERFARLVTRALSVPVALVSLVEADRQVFPGMVGLTEPWATTRQTPLSHSLCQHVTASGSPLVLPDARLDERTCTSLAIDDLGVTAYAGMPLTDEDGHVLGSLCAIDSQRRAWTERELADLADLAAACSGELRLRIASGHARQAQQRAERASAQVAVALQSAQLLLRAAEDLAGTSTLTEVRRSVRNLVTGDLQPSYVGLVLVDGRQLRRIPDPEISYLTEIHSAAFPLSSRFPSAQAVRRGEIVEVADRDAVEVSYGPGTAAEFDRAGLRSAVCVPLTGTRRTLGALVLGWKSPHTVDVAGRVTLTTIAGYTAQAIERALNLDERVTVARELQRAMLTDLPVVPGVEVVAAYHAAADGELVGGDWYDAYPLAGRLDGTRAAERVPLALTVGDITGHDIRAAAVMGQIRSMLRQADLQLESGPASAVTAVERACDGLSLDASGTLVHGHLRPLAGTASWQLTWTNAGHPPPLLRHADGGCELLAEHDLLLWPGMPDSLRADQRRVLAPGDILLLYTDGLVEDRVDGVDAVIAATTARLAAAPAGQPLPDLLDQLIAAAAGTTADDIALLAVRVPG